MDVGLTSALFPWDEQTWTVVWREASTHYLDSSSVIRAADTYDGGQTFFNYRTIHDGAYDARNFGGTIMGGGRLGIMAARRDGSGEYDPVFVYSDDNGSTWTSSTFALPNVTGSYEMEPYPASVGGHDTDGWMVPARDGGNQIHLFTTTDNGTNWSSSAVDTPTKSVSEVTIGRVGSQDKWLLLARNNDDGADAKALVYTSTDLTNWTYEGEGPILGENRPVLVSDDDLMHLMTTNRVEGGGEITSEPRMFLRQTHNADTLFANPTSGWGDWETVARAGYHLTGYPHVEQIAGKWYATVMTGENKGSSAGSRDWSRLSLLSEIPTEASAKTNDNLIAHLSASQTIGISSFETIVFDEWNKDRNRGLDTTTGEYTVQKPGEYTITVMTTLPTITGGNRHIIRVNNNSSVVARKATVQGGSSSVSNTSAVSLTVTNDFSQGDVITAEVFHEESASRALIFAESRTFLNITPAGGN